MSQTLVIILAAGEGSRMRSALPKVMHPIAGLPMLGHAMRAAKSAFAGADIAVVVGPDASAVSDFAQSDAPGARIFTQRDRLGTAHAVLQARNAIEARSYGRVVVLYGDTPLITPATLSGLGDAVADDTAVAVLGFEPADPQGYGRLIVDDGALVAIREDKDASAVEKAIGFCNSGVMAFDGAKVLALLDAIDNKNAKGEYYLTDAVEKARAAGFKAAAVKADADEVLGVNTRVELAKAEALAQVRMRHAVMLSGVTLIDPSSVYFSHDTEIGQDCIIEPNVVFGAKVCVGAGTHIRGFSHIVGAEIGDNADIGPYARLRPGARIGDGAKVGNFVEVKNATLDAGAKANHLSYVGDAHVGAKANIGAGVITCNYDGKRKHRTEIGAGAFIGSNSALVAPVTIGAGAYIGSGSVITKNVADNALAVARGRQVEKPGWKPKSSA